MKVLHVHERSGFFGGVEQILHDTASGLEAGGSPQGLLHLDSNESNEFLAPFSAAANDCSIIDSFDPDVILVHKLADAELTRRLAAARPTVRFVHDHDLYCPRRHKYFPLTGKVCERAAGTACYAGGCFVERAAPGSALPVTVRNFGNFNRTLQANRGMKRYIAGSRWVARQLERNGLPGEAIDVVNPVPKAVATHRRLPAARDRHVLFVGQVVRGKGVDLLLQALAHLASDWTATIVGGGNHLADCRALAERLGLTERVRFTDWVPHDSLADFYGDARVCVVPSRWPEPFGMVGLEAMALGRPVVAFATGGIEDWLAHEVNGLLCPPGDTRALASALERVLGDDALASQLADGAAATAGQRFGHERYLHSLTSALEHAL